MMSSEDVYVNKVNPTKADKQNPKQSIWMQAQSDINTSEKHNRDEDSYFLAELSFG